MSNKNIYATGRNALTSTIGTAIKALTRIPQRTKESCRALETMVAYIFVNFGWRFRNRIAS
jgi:hypothetical protein